VEAGLDAIARDLQPVEEAQGDLARVPARLHGASSGRARLQMLDGGCGEAPVLVGLDGAAVVRRDLRVRDRRAGAPVADHAGHLHALRITAAERDHAAERDRASATADPWKRDFEDEAEGP